MIKRLSDILFSIFFLIIFSPILLAVFLINLIGGNPIFYQKRLGQNGELIKVMKFRSMKVNAEEILKKDEKLYKLYLENNFKIPAELDPRITKFGSFLRKSSIDEMPQFINVLIGDMSIVGPRPIVENELVNYAPHEDLFLSAKPGITGLWQVSGRSNVIQDSRVRLDLEYIRKQNFFYDLKIIIKTPLKIFVSEGAF